MGFKLGKRIYNLHLHLPNEFHTGTTKKETLRQNVESKGRLFLKVQLLMVQCSHCGIVVFDYMSRVGYKGRH